MTVEAPASQPGRGRPALPGDHHLAADLGADGTPVVADLSEDALGAVLDGGVTVIKVSHEQLVATGRAGDGSVPALVAAMEDLARIEEDSHRARVAGAPDQAGRAQRQRPQGALGRTARHRPGPARALRRGAGHHHRGRPGLREARRPIEAEAEAEPGTDVALLRAGYASFTVVESPCETTVPAEEFRFEGYRTLRP
jgi:hypothetical protein